MQQHAMHCPIVIGEPECDVTAWVKKIPAERRHADLAGNMVDIARIEAAVP